MQLAAEFWLNVVSIFVFGALLLWMLKRQGVLIEKVIGIEAKLQNLEEIRRDVKEHDRDLIGLKINVEKTSKDVDAAHAAIRSNLPNHQ